MLSRREMVGKLAVGAAGAAVAWTATVSLAKAAPARTETNAPTGTDGAHWPAPAPQTTSMDPPVAAAVDPAPPVPVVAPPPWELVHPLAIGTVVAHGWRVTDLTGVTDGSCVLTLQNARGRSHRLHLCRNDGRPQGLVYTDRFDLVVMNGGQGDLPTEEGLAQAVAEVAHVLAANEHHWQAPVVTALLPHAERVRLFAGAADARLR